MYLKNICHQQDRHLTSVLLINNITDMNIYYNITWENIFPSDLRKLSCLTVKACLQEEIFSVFENLYHINITQQNEKTASSIFVISNTLLMTYQRTLYKGP